MPELDLGKVKMTDTELEEKINSVMSSYLNGFSFGYTEDGKPGFKEPNGDKFIAFNQVCEEPIEPSGKEYHLNWDSNGQYNTKTSSWYGSFGIDPNEIKTVTLNGQLSITSTSSSGYSYLELRGTKIGATSETNIKSIKSVATGAKNVKMTSDIENYIINVDEDIDWTVWDKEKPITLYYYGNNNYTYGNINVNIDLISKSNSGISIFHYLLCRNYDGKANSGLIFYNPELLEKIHLSGELKAYNQPSYLWEQGCKAGSSSFTNISNIKSIASGQTANIDMDYIVADWSIYDSDKGIKFYMYPASDTSSPGQLTANITYTIE